MMAVPNPHGYDMVDLVCLNFGVTLAALQTRSKTAYLMLARRYAYRSLWRDAKWSQVQIANLFNREHSNICRAINSHGWWDEGPHI